MFVSSKLLKNMRPHNIQSNVTQRMIFSRFFGTKSGNSSPENPKVFFDISKDSKPIG